MHLIHLFTAALTHTLVTADVIPPETNKWAQLRLFGSPGCEEDNLLELGVYGYQKNQCQDLSQYGAVEAVNVTDMIDECRCKSPRGTA